MPRILCHIKYEDIENDEGLEIESTIAECSLCGHETESFGTHEGSLKRCLALMNAECPRAMNNYYVPTKVIDNA